MIYQERRLSSEVHQHLQAYRRDLTDRGQSAMKSNPSPTQTSASKSSKTARGSHRCAFSLALSKGCKVEIESLAIVRSETQSTKRQLRSLFHTIHVELCNQKQMRHSLRGQVTYMRKAWPLITVSKEWAPVIVSRLSYLMTSIGHRSHRLETTVRSRTWRLLRTMRCLRRQTEPSRDRCKCVLVYRRRRRPTRGRSRPFSNRRLVNTRPVLKTSKRSIPNRWMNRISALPIKSSISTTRWEHVSSRNLQLVNHLSHLRRSRCPR